MRAHALILAAGQGRRFGGGKLHAPYRERPLLSYVLDVAEAALERDLIDGGHVIVGGDDDRARDLIHCSGLNAIINDRPELGLSSSLRLGLAALEARAGHERDAAVIFLGDQPLVRLEVVETLIARWREGGAAVIRPRYQSRPQVPGHPVLLTRSVWPAVRQLQGDEGFGALLDSAPFETVTLSVPGDNPDIDTRADLLGLEESSR
ncbi:MAG TPA: nucleotidyltransferase family protein [Gemmatimonadales bacterium]|nr:nucleotidyltransferase family protein [Gemmatimonadales bacterium]